MKTAKQDSMLQMYGTLEQFEKAIRKAETSLCISSSEAEAAILRYRAEWDAAATGIVCAERCQDMKGNLSASEEAWQKRKV